MGRIKSNRFDLHKALQNKSYNHALICTYTFDPNFFEEYCLQKFKSLHANPNISVFIDRFTYQNVISAPDQHKPKHANIRYLLYPVNVSGVFHSKIFLFARENAGRLIIGSANFTRPGITSNAELVGCFDYSSDNKTFLSLFQSTFQFFMDIQSKWPSETLDSNLQTISREASWLVPSVADSGKQAPILIHNFNTPIWDQILSLIKSGTTTIWLLSRYFDSQPKILDKLFMDLKPKKIKIFTQNGTTTMSEEWLKHPLVKNGVVEVYLCEYKDEDHYQQLHAKALYIEGNHTNVFSYGSANCTTPALMKTIKNGNLESVVVLLKPGFKQGQVISLFDPNDSAVQLVEKNQLVSVKNDPYVYSNKAPISLLEVTLIDNRIKIRTDIKSNTINKNVAVILSFLRDARQKVPIVKEDKDLYYADVSDNTIRRLEHGSTAAQVVILDGEKEIAVSNSVFVVNLIDINTGSSVRKERHIKEAQESVNQFFQVLNDLNSGNDDKALLAFLNYCDIPLLNVDRPFFLRGIRSSWGGGRGMTKIGERNLKIFVSLHGAAISFFDRHFKKLRKHVDFGGISGVANFLHIWLAMGGILRSQVERAMQGFEAKVRPMDADEWYLYRQNLDIYFNKFEALMNCLWLDYLSPLLKTYKIPELKKGFEPEMKPLMDLSDDMLNFRARFERIRLTKLKIQSKTYQVVTPDYFKCVLSQQKWPAYSQNIQRINIEVSKAFN